MGIKLQIQLSDGKSVWEVKCGKQQLAAACKSDAGAAGSSAKGSAAEVYKEYIDMAHTFDHVERALQQDESTFPPHVSPMRACTETPSAHHCAARLLAAFPAHTPLVLLTSALLLPHWQGQGSKGEVGREREERRGREGRGALAVLHGAK